MVNGICSRSRETGTNTGTLSSLVIVSTEKLVAPWEAASAMRLGGFAGYLKGPWDLVVL